MTEYPHLPRAPISEAIVDFRVQANPQVDLYALKAAHGEVAHDFPTMREIRWVHAELRVPSEKDRESQLQETRSLAGYQFRSADDKEIAQFRADGFTFNRLPPYTSWDAIFPTSWRLWTIYREAASPLRVTRLALRYINRLPLPGAQGSVISAQELAETMTAPPPIPETIPSNMSRFSTQVTVHGDQEGLQANIAQALEYDAAGDQLRLILDIDAFWRSDWDLDETGRMRATLHKLRDFKNRIFFASLTKEAIRRFE